MKINFVILTTWLLCLPSAFATGFSNSTNGIYLAVTEWIPGLGTPGTNEPFRFDNKLVWSAYCTTGKVTVWYPIDPAYGVKVKMFRPDGKEIGKTALGKSYGFKWENLYSYKETRLQPDYPEGSFEENHGEGSGRFIPPPQELFKMKEPGIYTMEIEIQMFRYVRTRDVEEWHRNLLRFSPVRIKVEKPPESNIKLPDNNPTNVLTK